MKQLKKRYALSLVLGIVAAIGIIAIVLVGMVKIAPNKSLFIPWAVAVKGSKTRFGILNISYRFLLNIFMCFGKSGWTWDFTRILIPAAFWAATIALIFTVIFSAKKEKRVIAPAIFAWLDCAGALWILEGIAYAQSIGAMRLRYAFTFGLMIGAGLISLFFLFSAIRAARQMKMVALIEESKSDDHADEIAALEGRIAALEAKTVIVAAAPAPVAAPKAEEKGKLNIQRIPFAIKLAASDKDLRAKCAELSSYISENYGIKARESIAGLSFSAHREKLVFVTVIGKHLRCNFALDVDKYSDSSLPVVKSNNKKYEDVPLTLKVKSDLSLRRAKALVDDVMALKGIEKIAK